MSPRAPRKETVPPTMQPHQAIPLLRRQYDRAEQLIELRFDDPKIDAWTSTTTNILEQVYGKPNGEDHANTGKVRFAQGGPLYINMPDSEIQKLFVAQTKKRQALLEAFIEQLQDLAPPAAATAPDQYRFHSEIERVSGHLFRGGHYKQAALEAYIRVIQQVRDVSGLAHDGDSLMNHAFGFDDTRPPVIQFNDLRSDSERDEQKGFMFLFKGIVGLRNAKAHDNRLFDDPYRGHDYLALASVLMRVLEIAKVNRPTP